VSALVGAFLVAGAVVDAITEDVDTEFVVALVTASVVAAIT